MGGWRTGLTAVLAALGLLTGTIAGPMAAAQTPQEIGRAEQAIREIGAEEWLFTPSVELVARVVEASSAAALRQAALAGNVEAQALMGSAHENGVQGIAEDQVAAADFYGLAAEAGNVLAQYNLGGMYLEGRGVPQNFERALYLRERAAEQGDRMAMSILGYQYLVGYGVEQDIPLARGYLEHASSQGDAAAMGLLGLIFEEGIGTAPNLQRAVAYYRDAALLGDPFAQEALRRLGK